MHKKIENKQYNQYLGRWEAITGINREEGKLWDVGVMQKKLSKVHLIRVFKRESRQNIIEPLWRKLSSDHRMAVCTNEQVAQSSCSSKKVTRCISASQEWSRSSPWLRPFSVSVYCRHSRFPHSQKHGLFQFESLHPSKGLNHNQDADTTWWPWAATM